MRGVGRPGGHVQHESRLLVHLPIAGNSHVNERAGYGGQSPEFSRGLMAQSRAAPCAQDGCPQHSFPVELAGEDRVDAWVDTLPIALAAPRRDEVFRQAQPK